MEYIYLAGRVTDLKNKTVEELKKLKELGMRSGTGTWTGLQPIVRTRERCKEP
jgi:hypothetical protein